MKHPLRYFLILLFSIVALLTGGCVYSVDMIEVAKASSDRRKGPLPESEWNAPGFWQRVGDTPPSYIPAGYARSAPRTEKVGTWVVDQRDGKRLFVPNTPVDGKSPGVWMGEARKVTNWPARETTRSTPGIMTL
jgi:hypothetical protein